MLATKHSRHLAPFPSASQPSWLVGHGIKMEVHEKGLGTLTLKGSVARLEIVSFGPKAGPHEYKVAWNVTHVDGYTSGSVNMNRDDVARAFGIVNGMGDGGGALRAPDGKEIHAAAQGLYFRRSRYLNIPHPGTGRQGDPNISVYVTDEIRKAVFELIS